MPDALAFKSLFTRVIPDTWNKHGESGIIINSKTFLNTSKVGKQRILELTRILLEFPKKVVILRDMFLRVFSYLFLYEIALLINFFERIKQI